MHVKKRITFFYIILLFIIIFFTVFCIFCKSLKNKIFNCPPIKFNSEKINLNQEKLFIQKENDWTLSIPSLNLYNIPIIDSIEADKLEDYIGHFPISSYFNGNVCLAAHNNGFKNNYFEKINTLKYGDKIIYNYNGKVKNYYVVKNYVISQEDFSVISLNDEDKLTLITCVSNSPLERLCIEAVFKE